MIKNRYKSIMKKWKKKYEKTSPKKIVSLVLKHLKIKMKKGDVNSSMSSNENEEVPIPTKKNTRKVKEMEKAKELKEPKEQESTTHPHKEPAVEKIEVKVLLEIEPEAYQESEVFEDEFDLGFDGFGGNFNNPWRMSVEAYDDENKAITAIVARSENYH
jgi:hypothetical protein